MNRRLRFKVFERDDFTCRYCGRRAPDVVLEADHRHPRSSGGTDSMDNLVTACQDCNRGKADVIVRRAVTLQGGPFDGVQFHTAETFPLFWVYEKDGHGIFHIEDGWRVVKVNGKRIASHFSLRGHPVVGTYPYPSSHDALWQSKPYPVLIGLYGCVRAGTAASEESVLTYTDPDLLLLRMTDLYFALDAQQFDEASIYEDYQDDE